MISELRDQINGSNIQIVELLKSRVEVAKSIGKVKRKQNLPIVDKTREGNMYESVRELAIERDLDPKGVEKVFKEIVDLVSGKVGELNDSPRVNIDEDMIFNIAENIIQNIQRGNLRNSELKEKFRQLTVEHFSWERIARTYVSNYTENGVARKP